MTKTEDRSGPGYVRGRHFTEYVEEVKRLKRSGLDREAEDLLLELVSATEAEAESEAWGVAPWYYEQLAVVYRKRGDVDQEVSILERFAAQPHAPGVMPPRLLERLRKARSEVHGDINDNPQSLDRPALEESSPNERVAAALRHQTLLRRDYLIITCDVQRNYYVQFPHPGDEPGLPESLYAEAVSNEFLDENASLGPEEEEVLGQLGWHPPRTPPNASVSNWWREFKLPSEAAFEQVARAVVETLRSVYDYAGGGLFIETTDQGGSPVFIEIAD
jgi:hypothetical protein